MTANPAQPASGPAYDARWTSVRALMREVDLHGLLVTHPPNLRYLTGFGGSIGALLLTADSGTLVVDGRYTTAARALLEDTPAIRDVQLELAHPSFEEAIAAVLQRDTRLRRVGVEASAMTLSQYARLSERTDALRPEPGAGDGAVRLLPVERLVERVRLVKDAFEIARVRHAAALLSHVARDVLGWLAPGASEQRVAARIDEALRRAGFERPAFDTIVASGPNSALPHARPGPRTLERGDGVLLDFGGVYDGYCVDLTRTVQLAPATVAFEAMFDPVRAAHAAAIARVGPGVRAREVDAAAREVLAGHGLADAFVHGTGHGLGLEVHEEPRISSAAAVRDEVLQPGMIFTIEPGVYVSGLGGVRLEDDVLVVDEGCDVLTDVPIDRTCPGPPVRRPSGG